MTDTPTHASPLPLQLSFPVLKSQRNFAQILITMTFDDWHGFRVELRVAFGRLFTQPPPQFHTPSPLRVSLPHTKQDEHL